MIKDILINSFISSATYNFGKEDSCSYVTNEKSSNEFLFQGLTSDLWYVILSSKGNTKTIWDFICKNQLEDEYEFFLEELYYSDLIIYGNTDDIYDNILNNNNDNNLYLETDKELLDEFLNEKKMYLYNNDFLYSLSIDIADDNQDALNDEDIIKIIDQAKNNLGVNLIELNVKTEKLNDKFFKIASYIREHYLGLNIKVFGHSLYNTNNSTNKIQKLSPRRLIVPIYSMDENINDKLTSVDGSLNKTINVINELKNKNISVNIYYEQLEENNDCLQNVLKYSYHIGTEFSCDLKTKDGNIKLLNLFNDDYLDITSTSKENKIIQSCQKLFISYNGNIYSDSKHLFFISNIKEKSISEIWNELIKEKQLLKKG